MKIKITHIILCKYVPASQGDDVQQLLFGGKPSGQLLIPHLRLPSQSALVSQMPSLSPQRLVSVQQVTPGFCSAQIFWQQFIPGPNPNGFGHL